MITEQDFTRINNDTNGNPRYVIHFLSCLPEAWRNLSYNPSLYNEVVFLMRKIGGKKFHNKQYGGGIVFQSYSLPGTIADIERVISEVKI